MGERQTKESSQDMESTPSTKMSCNTPLHPYHFILEKYSDIVSRIPSHVTLLAVSKKQPTDKIKLLYDQGHRDFGESYVSELISKYQTLPSDIQWHFIGHLQSNKVKKLSQIKSVIIHSIDSLKLLKLVEQAGNFRIFVQVNISNEEQKSGASLEEALELVKYAEASSSLSLLGLMMIGSKGKQEFSLMNEFREKVELEIKRKIKLSMGMSSDYEDAIQMGSDCVRIGTLLFGERIE